ncbi:MAG TPA: glycosyltransferase [Pirellulales bacterium]|nr:glycosyltransferase [Pirellulales bacterium]
MTRPWLSVIVPTYNGAAYLPTALESILAQGDPNIEVLAVDDGSTDATLDILRAYSARLPLKIIERQHAGNWVANTNVGVAAARGSYLSFLHQDDVWLPGRLRVLRRFAARWPAAALVVHPCVYLSAEGRRVGYWHCPLPRREGLLAAAEVVPRLLVQCFIGMPATLVRADAAGAIGPLDADLWYSADWEYWLRVASLGRTAYCPTPLAAFRIHAGSQTLTSANLPSEMERQQGVVLSRHLPRWRSEHPDGHCIARAANFSADVNVALANYAHGRPIGWRRLALRSASLGAVAWARYLRDSRIVERCVSRWQAGAVPHRGRLLSAGRRRAADEAPLGAAALGRTGHVATAAELGPLVCE